ncbi:type II secretion system F family protein [Phosphitispora sp. TUW77]|uniref:type II secretion system F family protein n=1 Tax=Phosphitispora sp. TUW77 TaxID=3152361 RepID=UPI003AB50736
MHLSLILVLVFLFVSFLIYGIFLTVTAGKRELSARMNTYTAKPGELSQEIGLRERVSNFNWKDTFQEASKVFAAKEFTKKVEIELIKADVPLKGEEFVLIILLAMAGLGFLFSIITQNIVFGWLGAVVGFVLPRYFIKRIKTKRAQKFNSQIGDSLIVMANSMRAGFSFMQSMEMVSKEMPAPISVEFNRALREMNLGTPTEDALLNITERIESEDMDLVITAVLIQRQVGGNLSEVLESISHTIRERIRIKGEIKTLTAQGRISGMVVGFLPIVIGLILSVINPSYIGTLFTNPIGWGLLVAGVISQTIGVALIRKTVDIKV